MAGCTTQTELLMNIYLESLYRREKFIFQFLVTLDAGVFLGIEGKTENGYSQEKILNRLIIFLIFRAFISYKPGRRYVRAVITTI